jgi:hypothetical protein
LSKRTSQPACTATTIMGVVHDALRRDLVRLQSALGSAPPPDGDRRMAIPAHARWMMDFLHYHHQVEDTGKTTPRPHPESRKSETAAQNITRWIEA